MPRKTEPLQANDLGAVGKTSSTPTTPPPTSSPSGNSLECAGGVPEYTCASCNHFTDCQSAFGAPGEVGLGCADWQPAPTLTNGGRHA